VSTLAGEPDSTSDRDTGRVTGVRQQHVELAQRGATGLLVELVELLLIDALVRIER
jgi:hypothetical protein